MKRTAQSLAILATSLFAALTFALPSLAADRSDSAMLSDCAANISTQFADADSVKASNIKSRRGIFKAKFRVSVAGDRSMVLCTIKDDQIAALSCLSGDACATSSIAAE